MNNFHDRYGTHAFIAGSAEGIGAAFAAALAAKEMNLVLADRDETALSSFIHDLQKKHAVEITPLIVDLGEPDAWKTCGEMIREKGCRLMVYNTAFSIVRPFSALSHEELDLFLSVNNRTMLHLVHDFISQLKTRKESGGILLMSSLAGLVGPRLVAPYAGTKGFINLLGEALYHELKQDHIDLTVCCAGTTSTPTWQASRPDLSRLNPGVMEPGKVAEYAIRNLGRKNRCIPGWKNRMQYFMLTHLLPRSIAASIVSNAMGKLYGRQT